MESPFIDRSLPVPLHQQVSEHLQETIGSGAFLAGDELPPEGELANHFEVSRSVVRQALSALVAKGLIETRKGRPATILPAPRTRSVRNVSRAGGLTEELQSQGKELVTTVIKFVEAPAPVFLRERLFLEECWEIHRLRMVDDEPIMYVINWVPKSVLPTLTPEELEGQSLHELIRQSGMELAGGKRFMTAVSAVDSVARDLKVAVGTPLLQVTGETRTTRNSIAEGFQLWHHPSFELEINASAGTDGNDRRAQRVREALAQLQEAISGLDENVRLFTQEK